MKYRRGAPKAYRPFVVVFESPDEEEAFRQLLTEYREHGSLKSKNALALRILNSMSFKPDVTDPDAQEYYTDVSH